MSGNIPEPDQYVKLFMGHYPSLRTEHIEAALAYAADLAEEELLLPLSDL